MPVLGPPWTAPMEFPLYQIVVAKLASATGMGLEPTGRLVGIVSGLASLALSWRILGLLSFSRGERAAALGALGMSPIFLYWSHSVMIETFSLALCLVVVVCALEFLLRDRVWLLFLGLVFSVLAALAKVTTFAVYMLVVVAVFAMHYARFAIATRLAPGPVFELGLKWVSYGLALFGPALLVTFAWVDFSDGVKAQSPLTEFLTSDSLSNWNYGGLGEAAKAFSYLVLPFRGSFPSLLEQAFGVLWIPLTLLAIAGWVLRGGQRKYVLLVMMVGLLAGPGIFSNLYETHYYYWVAVIPFLAVPGGLGLYWGTQALFGLVQARIALPAWARPAALAVVAVVYVTSAFATYLNFFLDRTLNRQMRSPGEIGELLRSFTGPDDMVAVAGVGWTPIYQYAADRPMLMMRHFNGAMTYAEAEGWDIAAVVFCNAARDMFETDSQHSIFAGKTFVRRGDIGRCDVYELTETNG